MEIISSNYLSKLLSKIPEFKIDLGISIQIDDSRSEKDHYSNWIIKDQTIKKYYKFSDSYPSRIGKIGTLLFYVDESLKNDDIYIINNNDIHFFAYDRNPDIRKFLSDVLSQILEKKSKPINKIKIEEETHPDLKGMSNKELIEYLSKK